MGVLPELFSTPVRAGRRTGDVPLPQQPAGQPSARPPVVAAGYAGFPAPYESAHAPPGGVTVQGKHYPGGQFIPGDVMAKASPQEKAAVRQGQSRPRAGAPPWPGPHPPGTPPAEHEIVNAVDRHAPPEEKVRQLMALTAQNKPRVDAFLRQLDARFGTESKSNVKLPDRVLEKSRRPSLKAKKPWFDVEHIRDSFRFKTVLNDIGSLPEIVKFLESELGATVVKRDVDKFIHPLEWGWRIVAFDLKMPNGQLVEYYLPVKEMEEQKGPNHVIFEKWRNRDMTRLTPDELREYEADREQSKQTYQAAYDRYRSRTGEDDNAVRAALAAAAARSASSS